MGRVRSPMFLPAALAKEQSYSGGSDSEHSPDWSELACWLFFGASGWFGLNCLGAELPLLIVELPEKERLGALLGLICQCGAVVLALSTYMGTHGNSAVRMGAHGDNAVRSVIRGASYVQVLNMLFCAFTYHKLLYGKSMCLLVSIFVAGSIGSLSNSTYYAFVSAYPEQCMKYMSMGASFGGAIAQTIAYLQVGNPVFSVALFLVLTAAIQWLQTLTFQNLSQMRPPKDSDQMPVSDSPFADHGHGGDDASSVISTLRQIKCTYVHLFLIRAMNYTMPATIPYLALAYPSSKTFMLFWIQFAQQWGETLGLWLAPEAAKSEEEAEPKGAVVTFIATGYMLVMVTFFMLFAFRPEAFTWALPDDVAMWLIPLLVFGFLCAYGAARLNIRNHARRLCKRLGGGQAAVDAAVRDVQSFLGFIEMMGGLSSNVALFLFVSYFAKK